ncbi:TM0996/MTH895 family glutaredoxin-like protein [Desulfohalobiaceae bacterium Ax17]|uniref:thioredoxin family protein n=1 Tax=Desulfovulcanus ferrireducens TaxID=2831190 RepID=UPI00207BC88B|nr:thioredoxin family protein [Desulfovulcanus ferrireducens]MBT8763189.1 TM0996/MTH895 family glutaredoxin-like protein [Desulfovulcanus ferrireducens]
MEIKILGTGCPTCQKTAKIVEEAVQEAGIEAKIEKLTDIQEIASYGVLSPPGIVIDGEVKSTGKVPTKEEVLSWLG